MTLTIELSPEKEAAMKVQAEARGLTIAQWLLLLAEQQEVQPALESIAHLQKTNPKEGMRQFRAWAAGHDRTTPPLSDEAISRDIIYPDRI